MEESIFEFEHSTLVLPASSRSTLRYLAQERAFHCDEMLSRGYPLRVVEMSYSRCLNVWFIEDTNETCAALRAHMLEVGLQAPLILTDN
jgi:hypothetical protein